MRPLVITSSFLNWVTADMIKLRSQNKVSLVSNRAEKAMTMNFPTSMPVFFRVFRVQEANLLSHLINVDGPSAFPVFFTHWTQHTVVYLNKATGCLANRGIPWLPSLSAIRVITILFKTVNKLNIPILPTSNRRKKDVFSSTQTSFSRVQHKQDVSRPVGRWLKWFSDCKLMSGHDSSFVSNWNWKFSMYSDEALKNTHTHTQKHLSMTTFLFQITHEIHS